jgi:hypothetical protein
MNALVKKEIRLLLPGWLAILSLEVLQPWFWRDPDYTFGITPVIFSFGMIILAGIHLAVNLAWEHSNHYFHNRLSAAKSGELKSRFYFPPPR